MFISIDTRIYGVIISRIEQNRNNAVTQRVETRIT